jgi:folate-binding protein YgfZ
MARHLSGAAGEEIPWWQHEYDALLRGAGVVRLPEQTVLRLRGADRASFLHNLSTNEIRKLSAGQGCEAFITNVQGKTIGHVYVTVGPDWLELETVSGQGDRLLAHLDRYLIREDVQLTDLSSEVAEVLVSGAEAPGVLRACSGVEPPAVRMQHLTATVAAAGEVQLIRVDWSVAPTFLLRCPRASEDALLQSLVASGAVLCGTEAWEAVRIEAGTPQFGADFSDDNLPQELARDAQAISFTKGCYLGQETVARIDALGHVNKTLSGVKWEGASVPGVGTELRDADKLVGVATSVTWSPALRAPLGLAMLRRGANSPGTVLESSEGIAVVVSLPAKQAS